MVITYFGKEYFKIQFGSTVVSYNPQGKTKENPKPSKFGADVVLSSYKHEDYNAVDNNTYGDKVPFVVDGAGEYEVSDVFIKGWNVPIENKGETKINVIYSMLLEDMNLVFLGPIVSKEIPPAVQEAMGDIDVLFVPIGGEDVLTAPEAYKLGVSLGAKVIVPTDFDSVSLETFKKEEGGTSEEHEKLTIKKKDLEELEGAVMAITPTS